MQQEFGSSSYVLESLPFALFCFLQSPGDFRRTLLDAVNIREDSDTTGAMACTLSGAYNGASGIPAAYFERLEYRFWLEGLAAGFVGRWEETRC
ncbi:MAG: ADP-ribosylglycohydrolase family protein [Limnochordales bacterium]|nr:ADP-ribosylglycohydrolase family protein [Limnochordales bacterium]